MRATSLVLWHPRPLFADGGASVRLLGAFVRRCGPPEYPGGLIEEGSRHQHRLGWACDGFTLLQDLQRLHECQ